MVARGALLRRAVAILKNIPNGPRIRAIGRLDALHWLLITEYQMWIVDLVQTSLNWRGDACFAILERLAQILALFFLAV